MLPLFHIYAPTVNMLLGLRGFGAELVLHTCFPDAGCRHQGHLGKKITGISACRPCSWPSSIIRAQRRPTSRSLRWCNSGGAPLPLEVQNAFQTLTGRRLAEG